MALYIIVVTVQICIACNVYCIISIIIAGQQFHNISPLMRNNVDYFFRGRLNAAYIHLLWDEFGPSIMNKKNFIELYEFFLTNDSFTLIDRNSIEYADDINTCYSSIKATF